uniref:Uncharacterized protein n=1 Tax=Arundo donax TaxID=35708 RepID=A0A0A9H703_ARUDO
MEHRHTRERAWVGVRMGSIGVGRGRKGGDRNTQVRLTCGRKRTRAAQVDLFSRTARSSIYTEYSHHGPLHPRSPPNQTPLKLGWDYPIQASTLNQTHP